MAAQLVENNHFKVIQKAAKKYPLFVNDFFMKRVCSFMNTILKDALGIDHYWGRVEIATGRGQIYLHMLDIDKDKVHLNDYYKAKTM